MEDKDTVQISGWWRKNCRDISQLLLTVRRCPHGFHAWCDELGFEATYSECSMDEAVAMAAAEAQALAVAA